MKIPSSHIIRVIQFLNYIKLLEIAINTGFLKRRKGLMPETLVKVFTFGLLDIPNPSLNEIASKCEEMQPGLEISKVAIYKRLKKASLLLQQVFIHAMKLAMKNTVPIKTANILSQFNDVKVCDSTKISLPDKLTEVWPGLGGRNAKSALKIQGVYSLISSRFSSIELTTAPGADTTYNDSLLKLINKGELLITDLGYFSKVFFEKLSSKGAYYLTRMRKNTVVYIENYGALKQIDLSKYLKDRNILDIEVSIGISYKKQMKCRLVAIRLPEEIANERRRKAHKTAKSQGKQLSSRESELLGWNIIITNVPNDMLHAEAICDLYRARWQIELAFKSFKSHLNIDKVGNCGQYQLECLIYGRLIAIIMIYSIYNALYLMMYKRYSRGISLLLFTKLFRDHNDLIIENMKYSAIKIKLLKQTLIRIAKKSLHEKRRRKTTFEVLQEYFIPKNNYQTLG